MMYELFPTPVLKSNIGRKITKEEFDYCSNREWTNNDSNMISVHDNILNDNIMKDILGFIGNQIYHFAHYVYKYDEQKIQFYITQSWLNKTTKGQGHHPHTHANSIFSGVFYIKANGDSINILSKQSNKYTNDDFHLPYKGDPNFNHYTTNEYKMIVDEGDLILFDSKLPHCVTPTNTEERISLSFNTFVKGDLGSAYNKTHLPL